MDDTITILIAAETWIRYGKAVYMQYVLTEFDFILPQSVTLQHLELVDRYAKDIHNNTDGYVMGFVACIFLNFYKLIAFSIVLTMFLPFFFNLVFSLFTFVGVLVLKYSFFAYGIDIYGSMHWNTQVCVRTECSTTDKCC